MADTPGLPDGVVSVNTARRALVTVVATVAMTAAGTYLASLWLLRLLTQSDSEDCLDPLTED